MKRLIQVDGSENRFVAEPSQTNKHNVGDFQVLVQQSSGVSGTTSPQNFLCWFHPVKSNLI